jgi:hypothetical protein
MRKAMGERGDRSIIVNANTFGITFNTFSIPLILRMLIAAAKESSGDHRRHPTSARRRVVRHHPPIGRALDVVDVQQRRSTIQPRMVAPAAASAGHRRHIQVPDCISMRAPITCRRNSRRVSRVTKAAGTRMPAVASFRRERRSLPPPPGIAHQSFERDGANRFHI